LFDNALTDINSTDKNKFMHFFTLLNFDKNHNISSNFLINDSLLYFPFYLRKLLDIFYFSTRQKYSENKCLFAKFAHLLNAASQFLKSQLI
jgi:hypothetical protein